MRRTYILLYLTLFIVLLLTDNQIRAVIEDFKNPILDTTLGSFTHIGKGHYQMLLSGILLLSGLYLRRGKLRESGKMGLATVVFAGICVQVLKHLIGSPRPSLWDDGIIHFGPSLKTGLDSFPSGHTTTSFALATVLSGFYPKGRLFFYFIATIVGLSRIYLNSHFPSDAFGGAILGFIIGRTFPAIFTRFLQTPSGQRMIRIAKEHWPTFLLIFFCLFLFFHKLGMVSLFDVDEAVFAEATREMVETGNWLTPQYNYTNRYDKPILFYWLMAIAYKVFGIGELQARFMSALFGTILVIALFYFTKKAVGRNWGLLTSLIAATSLEVIVYSRSAVTDITLTFFITMSLLCFYMGFNSPTRGKAGFPLLRNTATGSGGGKSWYLGFYIFTALAVLTKGPIGIVTPGLTAITFTLITGTFKRTLKEMKLLYGITLFIIIAVPWYALEIGVNGWEYINAFFVKHNLRRYTGVISGHGGPIYYFLPVLLLGFFPWSPFLPYAIYKYTPWRIRNITLTSGQQFFLFASVWFTVTFIFFSLSRTKLPNYILLLFPALAIMAGRYWEEFLIAKENNRGITYSFGFFILCSFLLSVGFFFLPSILLRFVPDLNPFSIGTGPYVIGVVLLGGTAIFSLSLFFNKRTLAFGIIVAMMLLFTYFLIDGILPIADGYLQAPLKEISKRAGRELGPEEDLIIYGLNRPSILFYSRRSAKIIRKEDEEQLREVRGRAYIITEMTLLPGIKVYNTTIIEEKGNYILLSMENNNT